MSCSAVELETIQSVSPDPVLFCMLLSRIEKGSCPSPVTQGGGGAVWVGGGGVLATPSGQGALHHMRPHPCKSHRIPSPKLQGVSCGDGVCGVLRSTSSVVTVGVWRAVYALHANPQM